MKRILGAVVLGILLNTAAHAQILLTVNISDPLAVTITATGAAPGVDGSLSIVNGVTLLGFYTSALFPSPILIPGNLMANGSPVSYVSGSPLSYSSGTYAAGVDLNLYRDGSSGTQIFSTLSPAFTGVGIMNLSAFVASLPSDGAFGDIRIGDGVQTGSVIGTYTVVPEPATVGILILGGCTTLLFRPRKRH